MRIPIAHLHGKEVRRTYKQWDNEEQGNRFKVFDAEINKDNDLGAIDVRDAYVIPIPGISK
ncbi:MAG: hypothetical protein V8T65_01025 [Roseburia inulinivorans]